MLGDEGSLVVENNTISISKDSEDPIVENIDDDGGYYNEFDDFYKGIREGQPVLSTFDESYRDLEIILQALESAERKVRVRF